MRDSRRKSLISLVVLIGFIGALLYAVKLSRDRTESADQETVDRRLERLLGAARAGDVQEYLNCFDGELRDRLEANLKDVPPERAAAELKSGEADLQSFATHPVEEDEDEAVVILERVYSRRNDRQHVRLRRRGDEWRIVELVPLDRTAPPIPYGTPVVPEAGDDPG